MLNEVARSVIESVRGENRMYVFTYCGRRLRKMNSSGYRPDFPERQWRLPAYEPAFVPRLLLLVVLFWRNLF
jgi:hypothetical protein